MRQFRFSLRLLENSLVFTHSLYPWGVFLLCLNGRLKVFLSWLDRVQTINCFPFSKQQLTPCFNLFHPKTVSWAGPLVFRNQQVFEMLRLPPLWLLPFRGIVTVISLFGCPTPQPLTLWILQPSPWGPPTLCLMNGGMFSGENTVLIQFGSFLSWAKSPSVCCWLLSNVFPQFLCICFSLQSL